MNICCPQCRSTFSFGPDGASAETSEVQCPSCGHTYQLALSVHEEELPPERDPGEGGMPEPMVEAWNDRPSNRSIPQSEANPESILNRVFGYPSFRENQKAIIDTLLAGRDVFALMPTGSGKSLCFQIPAIIRSGVGVVVSPLIALMQDQVTDLRHSGVRAHFLNSSLSAEDAARVEAIAAAGECDLLYVAPERLLTDRFQRLLANMDLALFAIDEAHCVSQWGHDFRPEYLQIADVTRRFPAVPRMALTATADPATRREIVAKLHLAAAARFVASFDRPNIFYRVQIKQNDKRQLLTVLRERHEGHAGIVYVRTRKRADATARWLEEKGISALPYHAGLDADIRRRNQRRFLMEEGLVMVATVAFGMGIDKPDIRVVIHLDLPSSMEAYYQETGRAGRDGQPAEAWLFYSMSDVVAMRNLQNLSNANEAFKSVQQRKLSAFLGFCESPECRRKGLMGYFGESYAPPCNCCDNCAEPVDTWDGTVAAQKALSCIYRTGQRFGAVYLIDVLTGKTTARMERLGHNRIKTFGVGQELEPKQWHSVFRQLLAAGCLDTDLAARSGLRLNENSWRILKNEATVVFRKDPEPVSAAARQKTARAAAVPFSDAVSQALWEKLRQLRLDLSRELSIPPYVIFHDKTLKEMAVRRPITTDDLLDISGVGQSKLERFGAQFLEVIKQWVNQ
ncbi:DNA helicase RecQ [Desulfosarcina sp.]|uniref:DNA helicase RecQ n=1 Tax=Desulfosarcina sp. TaxID=2027861 RepID=UPI0029A28E8F|nr:DNA helicase RecQ [Desulfosarcina sp.]MDX2455366.1 DNA helicase RecQ [Desulfosarcina sp.]MDX2492891.1 DNA helicase RecQ [Desulfosarcina sp.]